MKIKLVLLFSFLLLAQQAYSFDSYDHILLDKNASFKLCGELPYQRVRRDCTSLSGMEFKECLEREKNDPMLVEQEGKEYLCVNSESKKGAEILENYLINSKETKGCMVENIESLYGSIIKKENFKKMFNEYEEVLGKPIKLSYGIDTKNSIAFLQMDFNEVRIPGYSRNSLELSWSVFSEKGPCSKWNNKVIHKKMSKELTNITMIMGTKKKFDPLEGAGRQLADEGVYDGNRFQDQIRNTDRRLPASSN